MTVHCPHCLTGYLLPEHLLGGKGARVRCPGCQGVFVVLPEGEAVAVSEAEVAGEGDAGSAILEAMTHATSGSGEGASAAASVASGEHDLPATPAASGGGGGAPGDPPREEPATVAGAVLDVLADFLGDALTRSRARGTVLSDHGPAIIAVWDEYRRRAGAGAPSAIFRAALRDRCGVDLFHVNGG